MDDLREALARSLFDVVSGREMVADMLMRELRAYAARGDVVERVARALYARNDACTQDWQEWSAETREHYMADAKAALAAFLGEET